MSKAIRIHQTGGPEVLKLEDVEVGAPGPGEVKLRHRAIGLNFIEIYFRKGMYPAPLPFVPGNEGAGDIIAVGKGVKGFKVGDRVVVMGRRGGNITANQTIDLPRPRYAIDTKASPRFGELRHHIREALKGDKHE